MQRANERAWKALEVALAGEGLWQRLGRSEDKAFRQQVRAFLDALPLPELFGRTEFRRQCLRELKGAARKALLFGRLVPAELAEAAGAFAPFSEPQALLQAERHALRTLADDIDRAGFPALAWLLHQPAQADQSLVVVAVRYFFRREIESDQYLRNLLILSNVEDLGRTQEEALHQLDETLDQHGQRLEEALDEVADAVSELRDSVLDLREELQAQTTALGHKLDNHYSALTFQVLHLLEQTHAHGRPVLPSDSLSLHSDQERELVRELLRRYRNLPEEQRRTTPALLNGLGKLQLAAGDFGEAQDSFAAVAALAADGRARAEAHHNAYRATLERR